LPVGQQTGALGLAQVAGQAGQAPGQFVGQLEQGRGRAGQEFELELEQRLRLPVGEHFAGVERDLEQRAVAARHQPSAAQAAGLEAGLQALEQRAIGVERVPSGAAQPGALGLVGCDQALPLAALA